jgi:hypothetical protein
LGRTWRAGGNLSISKKRTNGVKLQLLINQQRKIRIFFSPTGMTRYLAPELGIHEQERAVLRSLLATQMSIEVKGFARMTMMFPSLPMEASSGGRLSDRRALGTLWGHRN